MPRVCATATTSFRRSNLQPVAPSPNGPIERGARSHVASLPVLAYLEGMEVRFTPEQETQLAQIANHAGTDAERLVKAAALRLLEEEARFRASVREGIAQADRGEFIEEEEMDARLEQMLRS
jgi:predicted transcriptional regulator